MTVLRELQLAPIWGLRGSLLALRRLDGRGSRPPDLPQAPVNLRLSRTKNPAVELQDFATTNSPTNHLLADTAL